MRKYIYIPLVMIIGVFIASCSDTTTNPPPVEDTGSIFITTQPSGAQIILDGTSTGKFTPDSVSNIVNRFSFGNIKFERLQGYNNYR